MAERPEDLNLPNAVVTRIIKDAIPSGVAVSKEARLAISKAASVFVLYATSCSNNFALRNKRKTINAQDVLSAMEDMEFEQFIDPLQQCQEAFQQEKKEKKKEKIVKQVEAATVEEEGGEDDDDEEGATGNTGGAEKEQEEDCDSNEAPAGEGSENFTITVNDEEDGGGDGSGSGTSSEPEMVEDD